ncbi:MAG TPA: GntR family transcriptional regulator [Bryobacteraceae bacterium]|nr:GntR family transcriptional regulator [Bryobacteraceae bacterium]
MIFRVSHSSGIPLYLQLMEQVKHAIETGALRAGEQLPTIRKLAEDLVMNPNTVVRAYRELEHEGVVELRHGSGAYISDSEAGRVKIIRRGQAVMQAAIEKLLALGISEPEIRRLLESELSALEMEKLPGGGNE